MHVCACIFIFDKDKSTLNKSTSHYAGALMCRRSNASCITDTVRAVIAFSFRHLSPPPLTRLPPSAFIAFTNQKRNQIHLQPCTSAPKQQFPCLIWSCQRGFISSPCWLRQSFEYCIGFTLVCCHVPQHFRSLSRKKKKGDNAKSLFILDQQLPGNPDVFFLRH